MPHLEVTAPMLRAARVDDRFVLRPEFRHAGATGKLRRRLLLVTHAGAIAAKVTPYNPITPRSLECMWWIRLAFNLDPTAKHFPIVGANGTENSLRRR